MSRLAMLCTGIGLVALSGLCAVIVSTLLSEAHTFLMVWVGLVSIISGGWGVIALISAVTDPESKKWR